MIFKTLNNKIEKSSSIITFANIDLSSGHWGSEKEMLNFLDNIETLSYNKDSLNKNLVLQALKLKKANHRIEEMKFYRIPEENKIILLVVSDIGKMHNFEVFSREMNISLKRDKFSFSIVEVLKEEFKDIQIPEKWKLDEPLTDRFAKLKDYV